MSNDPLFEIESELGKLPPAVTEAYREVSPDMGESFNDEELTLWAREGSTIGAHTVRSWESAVEYYRVSPSVARALAFPSFMQCAR